MEGWLEYGVNSAPGVGTDEAEAGAEELVHEEARVVIDGFAVFVRIEKDGFDVLRLREDTGD